MYKFFTGLIGSALGYNILEGITSIHLGSAETPLIIGTAGVFYLLDGLKKNRNIEVTKKGTEFISQSTEFISQPNEGRVELSEEEIEELEYDKEYKVLHRVEGLKEIAEQPRLSLNGLIIQCVREERSKYTLYSFHYLNREQPFIKLMYNEVENDVQVLNLEYVIRKKEIKGIMDKIISKIFLIEHEKRGIIIPQQFQMKSEKESIETNELLTNNIDVNAISGNIKLKVNLEKQDDFVKEADQLIEKINKLSLTIFSKNEKMLKMNENSVLQIEETKQVYQSLNKDTKEKVRSTFLSLLKRIEQNTDTRKDLTEITPKLYRNQLE